MIKNQDEYTLRMDAETAGIVARACELYARIRCGQFEEIRYLTVHPQENETSSSFSNRSYICRAYLDSARQAAFPELKSPGESWGMGAFRDSDIAWNVYQTVRYVKSWHEHPEGGFGVCFDEPLNCTGVPMPHCEVRGGFVRSEVENGR